MRCSANVAVRMQQHTANPVPNVARLCSTSAEQMLQATTRLGSGWGFETLDIRNTAVLLAAPAPLQLVDCNKRGFLVHHLRHDDVASLRRFALCAEQVCTDLSNLGHAVRATLLRG